MQKELKIRSKKGYSLRFSAVLVVEGPFEGLHFRFGRLRPHIGTMSRTARVKHLGRAICIEGLLSSTWFCSSSCATACATPLQSARALRTT